jgi:hypothetical protein
VSLKALGGPFPALLVSVEAESDPGDGAGYDTDRAVGDLVVYCMTEGGLRAEEAAWDLAADVRRVITLDRNLNHLFDNGYIKWEKTECAADPLNRDGFAVAVVRFKYVALSAHTDP